MPTTTNTEFSITNYFPLVNNVLDSGEEEESIDFFNPEGISFMGGLTPNTNYVWEKSLRLDVMSYRQFGTVSAWWLPLFFNGAPHFTELNIGTFVNVPLPPSRINSSRSSSPGRGSRVRL